MQQHYQRVTLFQVLKCVDEQWENLVDVRDEVFVRHASQQPNALNYVSGYDGLGSLALERGSARVV